MFQQNIDWPEIKSHQAAEGLETSEDHQQDPQAKGGLRLRDHLSQERVQHPHRLHPLPVHLRRGRSPAVQREVLLLQRREQAQCRGLSVSYKLGSPESMSPEIFLWSIHQVLLRRLYFHNIGPFTNVYFIAVALRLFLFQCGNVHICLCFRGTYFVYIDSDSPPVQHVRR